MKTLAVIAAAALLTACGGGGGSSALPGGPKTSSPAQGSIAFTLKVPAKSAQLRPHLRNKLAPNYLSPATLGVGFGIALSPASPPAVQNPTVAFDLSTCNAASNCVANNDGSKTYTLVSPLVPTGTYNIEIATWDVSPTAGTFPAGTIHELSDALTSTAIAGANTNVNVTLNGIPINVVAAPIPGQIHAVPDANYPIFAGAYDIIGNVPTQWAVTALDNDGYIIAGDGAPSISFIDATNSFVEAQTATPSNLYTITATTAQNAPITVTLSATGLGPSAVISENGSVSILPVQELWQTVSGTGATGQGIFGFAIYPHTEYWGSYFPLSAPNYSNFVATDMVSASTQNFEAIAQDSTGALSVYDSAAGQIDQYLIGTSGSQQPIASGTTISTAGKTIVAMAGDHNGFLYALDTNANAIDVYAITGASPTLKYTFDLVGPAGNDISIVPNVAGLPAGIAGSIVASTDQGIVFYTNASAGMPTQIGLPLPGGISTFITRAAVSPDTGGLWTNEASELGYYTITSGPAINLVTSTSLYNNDNGPLRPAISDYLFSVGGTENYAATQYFYSTGNVTHDCCSSIGNGASSPDYLGLLVAP